MKVLGFSNDENGCQINIELSEYILEVKYDKDGAESRLVYGHSGELVGSSFEYFDDIVEFLTSEDV